MTVPIITYHAIADQPSPLFVSPHTFDLHLRMLSEAGWHTTSLHTVADCLKRGLPLPEKAVVITFDDGYASVFSDAWPRLQAYGFTATVFLISDYCGRDNQWPGQPASVPTCPLMTWEQAAEMGAAGCEMGAHTRTHRALPTLPAAQAEDEIAVSQQVIQQETGQSVDIFAQPYGATNVSVDALVRRYFEGAASTYLGLVRGQTNRYALERVDAFYLTPYWLRRLDSRLFEQYLRLRQGLRTVRRQFRPDWNPSKSAVHG
ncbi:MAG: polysaccharide deacetylase family protein [Anaerolineae bacterium]|nr:polysaccharide deacetylase family protein [Anaerolineae bacterium]